MRVQHALCGERIRGGLCPSCGKPKSEWKRRTDWTCCSVECSRKYWDELVVARNWAEMRVKVFERDGFRCVRCKSKPVRVVIDYRRMDDGGVVEEFVNTGQVDSSLLVADHVVAIALGGEEWDMDNIQTLCKWCNKEKTRIDIGKIARLRDVEKKLSNGQVTIKESVGFNAG